MTGVAEAARPPSRDKWLSRRGGTFTPPANIPKALPEESAEQPESAKPAAAPERAVEVFLDNSVSPRAPAIRINGNQLPHLGPKEARAQAEQELATAAAAHGQLVSGGIRQARARLLPRSAL